MKKVFNLSATAIMLTLVFSCQDTRKAKNYNDKTQADQEAIAFIRGGIEGGLTEIKAANLAKSQSSNPRIIRFANMMITDHTQVGQELKKIEADKLVDDRDSINSEHQKLLTQLAAKSGADFDKAYIQMMVTDHEKAIKLFNEASSNTSATIQDFAENTLPKLHMHLDSAKAINASLK